MRNRCTNLTFSADCFEPLCSIPFVKCAAQSIVERLEMLAKIKNCFDAQGRRTTEGQRLYQEYFTGTKAWFTDSSDSEKNEFKAGLTFNHPDNDAENLFCTWHGKINSPKMRIHFSWPISTANPLYVVYIGPKITKK